MKSRVLCVIALAVVCASSGGSSGGSSRGLTGAITFTQAALGGGSALETAEI